MAGCYRYLLLSWKLNNVFVVEALISGKLLCKLNARQSENFLEFVQNPFFSSFESILSSFIITKRSGKQEWLCSRVVVVSKVRGRVDAVSTLDKIS